MGYKSRLVLLSAVFCFVFLSFTESGAMVYTEGEPAGPISGLRAAVFHEEEFPSKSPRDAQWYGEVLSGAGVEVSFIGADELLDADFLTTDNFDFVIVAAGGYFPIESEEALGLYLNAGGVLAVDGAMMVSDWSPPEDIAAERNRMAEDYAGRKLRGADIHRYHDFVYKHGLYTHGEPKLFHYNEELSRWTPRVEAFTYAGRGGLIPRSGGYFQEFELFPWPNPGSPTTPYRRPFDSDLSLNPLLEGSGLPGTLPREIFVSDSGAPPLPGLPSAGRKIAASDARADGFVRFQSGRSPGAPEYVNCVLFPVYFFPGVSGTAYPAYTDAGRDSKDRESDFYIVRYHTGLRDGGTLIHFGAAGAHLLKSDAGRAVLLRSLRLGFSKLPGERREEFIEAFNELDSSLRTYQGAAIEMMDRMEKLSRALLYSSGGDELAELSSKLSAAREEFESLSNHGEHLYLLAGERADAASHGERKDFIPVLLEKTREKAALLEGYESRLAGMADPPGRVSPEHFLGRLTYGFSHINPAGITRLKGLYPLIEKLGFSIGPYYHTEITFDTADMMQREHGISTGYRMSHPSNAHIAKTDYVMGILDPETGIVSSARPRGGGWFDTPEDWELYEEDVSWFLKKADARPGISYVVNLEERNLGWSMWGERMLLRFRNYITIKHKTIEALNEAWGSGYKSFDDIVLPVKRPETRAEHALWEDWTRYREIYYLEEEVKPEYDIIKRHAPRMWMHGYGSYHQQNRFPANGINFYEVFSVMNPSTFETGHHLHNEIIASDIAGFHNRNLTSEWNVFYFPPPAAGDQIDRLKYNVWKGATWGQAGIQTFMGARAGRHSANFINMDNNIMPLGWAMKFMTQELRLIEHIILDGKRAEPPVRVLYSPTTRRHTSWPGIELDMPMQEVSGYYSALNSLHVPVRAIDEGAVMDGYLSDECRLLILPRVVYVNDGLLDKVLKFVEAGGNVLINPDTGRYNEYGERKDSFLSLAGVSDLPVSEARVVTGQGEFDAGASGEPARALRVLFPEDTRVIMRYRSGEAALTSTGYGRGRIIVSGIPFGASYINFWQSSPGDALSFLKEAVSAAGVEIEYVLNDSDITLRPWEYGGKKYIMLANTARTGMVRAESGPFPFMRAPRMTPVTMRIKGNVRLKDYVLGMDVPGDFDGKYTEFKILAPSPGGIVYEVGAR